MTVMKKNVRYSNHLQEYNAKLSNPFSCSSIYISCVDIWVCLGSVLGFERSKYKSKQKHSVSSYSYSV